MDADDRVKCSVIVRANMGKIEICGTKGNFLHFEINEKKCTLKKSSPAQIIKIFFIDTYSLIIQISLQKKIMMLLCAAAVGCILVWYVMTTFYNPF